MQLGHVPLALAIASYDWNPKTVAFCLAMHFLPNADSLIERTGLVPPKFHCTVTHTLAFAAVVSGLVALVSPHYGVLTLVCLVTHYLADLGSTVGLPLLWPFSKRKFSLRIFRDTGYWGKEMYLGYYRQPRAWVLEGAVVAFLVYRLVATGVIAA
jgi:membrane-bound metal-dependent hydrolase YbcI (DUF457 family)